MASTDVKLPSLLTIDQLARHLGTSHRHIRRLIADRRIPYVKVGRLIRFDPTEIADWIDGVRMPERRGQCGRVWSPSTSIGDFRKGPRKY